MIKRSDGDSKNARDEIYASRMLFKMLWMWTFFINTQRALSEHCDPYNQHTVFAIRRVIQNTERNFTLHQLN